MASAEWDDPAERIERHDPLSRSRWGLRFSIQTRSGKMLGTLTVPLDGVPRGKTPKEVAERWLTVKYPGTVPVLPRAIVLDTEPVDAPLSLTA